MVSRIDKYPNKSNIDVPNSARLKNCDGQAATEKTILTDINERVKSHHIYSRKEGE